jgi:hypothetical protein
MSAAEHVAKVLALGSPVEVLRWHRDQVFDWRSCNCCVVAGDYHLSRTGNDVIAPWRWTYGDTSAAAMGVISAAGGMAAFWLALGSPIELPQFQNGDVLVAATEAAVWHEGAAWLRRPRGFELLEPDAFDVAVRL